MPKMAQAPFPDPPWKVFGTLRGKCSAPAVESVRRFKNTYVSHCFCNPYENPSQPDCNFWRAGIADFRGARLQKNPSHIAEKRRRPGGGSLVDFGIPSWSVGRAALVGFRCLFFSPVFLFGSVRHGPLGSWAFG